MVESLEVDCKKLWECVNSEIFLNVDFALAAAAFKASRDHALWFNELFEALFKLDTA